MARLRQADVAEVEAGLNEGDYGRAQDILVYERAHKNRPEVVQSALVPARFLLSTSNRETAPAGVGRPYPSNLVGCSRPVIDS